MFFTSFTLITKPFLFCKRVSAQSCPQTRNQPNIQIPVDAGACLARCLVRGRCLGSMGAPTWKRPVLSYYTRAHASGLAALHYMYHMAIIGQRSYSHLCNAHNSSQSTRCYRCSQVTDLESLCMLDSICAACYTFIRTIKLNKGAIKMFTGVMLRKHDPLVSGRAALCRKWFWLSRYHWSPCFFFRNKDVFCLPSVF